MSQVYATEPQTTGRVILETSHGPLDLNLWCKECPSTTRMFLQLCLDGYYDSVVFHRIMENFLIQAGQVKFVGGGGGGRSGEEATRDVASAADMKRYLSNQTSAASVDAAAAPGDSQSNRRKLEVSPRIRFNHRGQVAMGLPLDEDVEGNSSADALRSQFFITLDESSFLDGKHVIFGTITGPTVFNAIRIGKVDVEDDTSRPVDMDLSPPIIKSVKIDTHPFHDLIPTPDDKVPWKRGDGRGGAEDGPAQAGGESEVKKRRKKRKGKRDLNVLSFGQEMEDDTGDGAIGGAGPSSGGGMRSSHDVLASESKFLSSSIDDGVKEVAAEDGGERRSKKKRRKEEDRSEVGGIPADATSNLPPGDDITKGNYIDRASREGDHRDNHQSKGQDDIDTISRSKNSRKEKASDKKSHQKAEKTAVSAVEARRAKYLKGVGSRRSGGKDKSRNEEDTLKKLSLFRSKVLQSKGKSKKSDGGRTGTGDVTDNSLAARMAKRSLEEQKESEDREAAMAPTYHGQVLEDDFDDDNGADSGGWMETKFKCRKHIDHGSKSGEAVDDLKGGDGRRVDDYEVVDGKAGRDNNDKRSGKHQGGRSGKHGGRKEQDDGQNRHHRARHHHHERSKGTGGAGRSTGGSSGHHHH